MNVLMVLQHAKIGGIEQHVLTLAKELSKENKVLICFAYGGGSLLDSFSKFNLSYIILNCKNGHDTHFLKKFDQVLKDFQPDIIHAHVMPFMLSVYLLFHRKLPVVVTEHMAKKERLLPFRSRMIAWWAQCGVRRYISVSNSTKFAMVEQFRIDKSKITTVYNGVVPHIMDRKIRKGRMIIGGVGRLVEGKGWYDFLEIAELLHKKNVDAIFVIIGDGPLREKIEQTIKSKNLEHIISITGWVSDVRELVQRLDFFLLLSEHEACPLSLIEACMDNIPIVGYLPLGGVSEINNEIWPLFNKREPSLVTNAIIELMKDATLLNSKIEVMSKRMELFTAEAMSEQILNLYREVGSR